jgi:hypothetical protein
MLNKPDSIESPSLLGFAELIEKLNKEKLLLGIFKNVYCSEDEHLNILKLIVLSFHQSLEIMFNFAIIFNYGKESMNEAEFNFFEDKILSRINYREKIEILAKLRLLSKEAKKKAERINTLRNLLLHLTQKKLMYNKKNVKDDKTVIDEIFEDYKFVHDCVTRGISSSKK